MTPIPTPSAWRDNCVPMFTSGQLNQYGQACFEEGSEARAMVDPMTEVADRYAHRMALELECVLADRPGYYDRAMQVLGEYRSAMNAIHEQHSQTRFGEPVLPATPQGKRQPLTDDEIKAACAASDEFWATSKLYFIAIARAIEEAHGIKA